MENVGRSFQEWRREWAERANHTERPCSVSLTDMTIVVKIVMSRNIGKLLSDLKEARNHNLT